MSISAKVIQHSRHYSTGTELVTFEIEFPRIILAEINTHKMLVRNTQSTRAVPIKSMLEQLENDFYMPKFWGKNKSGMVATEENNQFISYDFGTMTRENLWLYAKSVASEIAESYSNAGYHKQIVGRLLEPFSMVRMVISGTEWDNFFNLRIEPSAQPEFRELAIKMYLALKNSVPFDLYVDEWHLPYIERIPHNRELHYYVDDKEVDLETAKKISLSCIAQTSYRKHDTSEEKADNIIDKLFNGDVIHASPSESIATPMNLSESGIINRKKSKSWEDGITHITKDGNLWSAQFKHFIQYRQLIPNHVCNNFTEEKFNQYTDQ